MSSVALFAAVHPACGHAFGRPDDLPGKAAGRLPPPRHANLQPPPTEPAKTRSNEAPDPSVRIHPPVQLHRSTTAAPAIQNEGTGLGFVYDVATSTPLLAKLRTLSTNPREAGITISADGPSILLGNAVTGTNLGRGQHVFASKDPATGTLRFNSLVAGDNITITPDGSGSIVISAAVPRAPAPAPAPVPPAPPVPAPTPVPVETEWLTRGEDKLGRHPLSMKAPSCVTSNGHSVIMGTGAITMHNNCFVWGDGEYLGTSAKRQFLVGASGDPGSDEPAVAFYTNPSRSVGVCLNSGSSAWATLSDRGTKENLVVVDPMDVLGRVEKLPIYRYNYKDNPAEQASVGPMADDWYDLFPTEKDKRSIETIDLDGISLAAIKGLAQLVREQGGTISAMRSEIDDLKGRLRALGSVC